MVETSGFKRVFSESIGNLSGWMSCMQWKLLSISQCFHGDMSDQPMWPLVNENGYPPELRSIIMRLSFTVNVVHTRGSTNLINYPPWATHTFSFNRFSLSLSQKEHPWNGCSPHLVEGSSPKAFTIIEEKNNID